jgi:glutamine cyclotransferase
MSYVDGCKSLSMPSSRVLAHAPLVTLLFCSFVSFTCQREPTEGAALSTGGVPTYGYQILHAYPHDADAFTQGLEFRDGQLLESTGEVGRSSLRRVELETGKVLQRIDVPRPHFAEGITRLNGKIYQLTWQDGLGFIYDATTFEKIDTFKYEGEGWGLTNDGRSLMKYDLLIQKISRFKIPSLCWIVVKSR